MRGDGDLDVHRVVEGVATPLGSSTGGTALRTGTYVPLRITVTGSDMLFTRTGGGASVTVTDATHRPVPVVHLGGAFAAVRFRNVEFA